MIKVTFKHSHLHVMCDTWAEALDAAEANIITEMKNCNPNACESDAHEYNCLTDDLQDIRNMKWYLESHDVEFFCLNGHTVALVDIDALEYQEYQEKYGTSIEDEPYDDYDDGYSDCLDEVGGYHADGIGCNPHGVWCGECCKETCKGCKYENIESEEEIEKMNEQVWIITCTEWDEPEVHRTYQGAYETLVEDIKALYEYEGEDFSELVAEVKRQYDAGYRTISVEDSLTSYRIFATSLMD